MANYDSTNTGANIDSAVNQIIDSSTDLNVDTNTLVVDKSADSVGIGNTVPGSMLEISKVSGPATLELSSWAATATAAHAGTLKFQKSGTATVNTFTAGDHTTSGEVLGRVEAYGVNDSDASTLSSYIEFANDAVSDADSSPGKISFATSDADDAGTPTVRMTIDDDGSVGIGTSSPNLIADATQTCLSVQNSDNTDDADRPAVLQLSNVNDGSGVTVGTVEYVSVHQDESAAKKRVAHIQTQLEGSTSSDRGARLAFATKPDNGAITERMRIDSSGNVAIGTANINHKLDVKADAGTFAALIFNDGSATSREGLKIQGGPDDASGTTNMVGFYDGDGTVRGTIHMAGATITYNAFTAGHYAELPNTDNDDGYAYGTLLETTEIFYARHSNTLASQANLNVPAGEEIERGIRYKVQKTSTAYSKSVLGSYADKFSYKPATLWEEKDFEEGGEGIWKESDFTCGRIPENKIDTAKASGGDVRHEAENENLHQVFGLGDGHILCNSEKGNISVGDGITSSSTDGQGMKADKMCMIIGMAQEDVSFSGDESKLVAVQYGLQQFTPWE